MAKMQHHPDFLLERELAHRWRISARSLQRWRRLGTGPDWLKIQGRVIYPWTEVLEWEREARRSADQRSASS